jgi:hypothetical protein
MSHQCPALFKFCTLVWALFLTKSDEDKRQKCYKSDMTAGSHNTFAKLILWSHLQMKRLNELLAKASSWNGELCDGVVKKHWLFT